MGVAVQQPFRELSGLRAPGTGLPGVIALGTWRGRGQKDFAALFDAGKPCGPEANMAKYLASEASWEAADVAMATLGGYGLARE